MTAFGAQMFGQVRIGIYELKLTTFSTRPTAVINVYRRLPKTLLTTSKSHPFYGTHEGYLETKHLVQSEIYINRNESDVV